MFSFIAQVIVSIDLGTTNSSISVMERQQAWVIKTSEGAHMGPSVVAFTKHNEHLVSSTAKHQAVVNSFNTIFT